MQVGRLQDIQSRTRDNFATVDLDFAFQTNPDLAFLEVNEKIDQIMGQLPREMPRPNVVKTNAADLPSLFPQCLSQR